MPNPPKMKDAFVAIHGHFYQPPRENPWLEAIETEESAHPFHDWNERITFECYRPNAYARIVDNQGKILDIINNYSLISFNFGPTLLSWMEEKKPLVYRKILEADREGLRRFGHGNAMAQVYNHIIMPLANERDKETEVLWGIADFEKRFHRKPEAMWLPETAVDYLTLRILVKYGMRYLILSPFQALRVRPFGGKKWTDVSHGKIDTTQPYRCFIKDSSGKKVSDQFIDLFFYDGVISKEVAFGDLLKNGNAFCERFAEAYQSSKKGPQLIHIATDGETYGHHKKFGDMTLAYALKEGMASYGFEIINYSAFLKRFPPVYEVEVDEGPEGEGSSWSCAHGVARWKEDCGCSTGGEPGWNQKWRKPLREALDLLRDELIVIYEKEGEKIFKDGWEARNAYIEVILDRSPKRMKAFLNRYGVKELDNIESLRALKLLEMERHALLMYTSCGWFFADLAGLETVQILQYAGRAIQLAEELTGHEIEGKFLERLADAKSNVPEMGNGKEVYQRFVKPKWMTADQVVSHFAISSLFDEGEKEKKFFSYRVERLNYEKIERNDSRFVVGQVRVTSEIIPEPRDFLFGLMPSTKDIFRIWVSEPKDGLPFDTLREKVFESIERGEEETAKILTSLLGGRIFTVRDALKEERQTIFQKLIQKELDEHRQIYAELFDRTKQAIGTLVREGLEIPDEIRMAAEVTLSDRLIQETKELRRDLKGSIGKGKIDQIIDEAKERGYRLKAEASVQILNEILKGKMELLHQTKCSDLLAQEELIGEIITLLDAAKKWGFEISKAEAQDLMEDVLVEYLGSLEKFWWGEGVEKRFPHNLLTLAEKLGFNMERFSKIAGPSHSVKRNNKPNP